MRIRPLRWRRARAAHGAKPALPAKARRALCGPAWIIASACALAGVASPAAAYVGLRTAPGFQHVGTGQVRTESVEKIAKGPLQIIISIDRQKLHLYSNGIEVADTSVATGVRDHPTPLGIFSIIQKSRNHRSNIYSNAPMPFMERLTWSGVALHEGGNLGHPASHGCIRMSHEFAVRLWNLTGLGARVVIAGPELQPQDISDAHLFVRKERPAEAIVPASAPSSQMANVVKAATAVADDKTTDVAENEARPGVGPGTVDGPLAAAALQMTASIDPTAFEPAVPALDPDGVPMPPPKPAEIARPSKAPIAIFVSGKDKKIYVRQNLAPLFDAAISVDRPDHPLGTHVFTAMEYLIDGSSFRWNVISLPTEEIRTLRQVVNRKGFGRWSTRRRLAGTEESVAFVVPETPRQALSRIEIPQDVIDQISQLIVPGSSLVISDQGLGEETGEGTNFIVITH